MNVGIIISNKEKICMRLLRESLESRGHVVTYFNNKIININEFDLSELKQMDVVYFWSGFNNVSQFCIASILKDKYKIPIVNSAILDNPLIRNKIFQIYTLRDTAIKIPKTIITKMLVHEEISKHIGQTYIGKVAQDSCKGRGVRLIHDQIELDKFNSEFLGREKLYQEYIPYDADFRVNVIGGVSVSAFRRQLNEKDFRSDVSLVGQKIDDTELLSKLFYLGEIVSREFIGAENVGIDFIKHKKTGEIYFLEINSLPFIEKKENIGFDVANELALYLERRYSK